MRRPLHHSHHRGLWYAWLTLKDQITLRLSWQGHKDVTLLVGNNRIVWQDVNGDHLAALDRIYIDQESTFVVSGSDSLARLWIPSPEGAREPDR